MYADTPRVCMRVLAAGLDVIAGAVVAAEAVVVEAMAVAVVVVALVLAATRGQAALTGRAAATMCRTGTEAVRPWSSPACCATCTAVTYG